MQNVSHSTGSAAPTQEELDWLLEISVLATPPKGFPLQDRSERLTRMMRALVEHFGCALAALLIPHSLITKVARLLREHPVPASGMSTVAEYAETEQIIQRLRDLGVEYAQGYGIEKPRALSGVLAELAAACNQTYREGGANREPCR